MENSAVNFDPCWEEKYSLGHEQRYPWDSVVSFVFRNAPKDRPRHEVKILEVGCGTGSNLWFAAREGFSVAGVDASASAITKAQSRFQTEGLSGNLRVGNFINLPFREDFFDLVIDRAAITCVDFVTAKQVSQEIKRVLKTKGRFFFNPYSERHSSHCSGVGNSLRREINEGTLTDTGQIFFYSRNHIMKLLTDFKILSLQHMEWIEMLKPSYDLHAEWRVVVEKV